MKTLISFIMFVVGIILCCFYGSMGLAAIFVFISWYVLIIGALGLAGGVMCCFYAFNKDKRYFLLIGPALIVFVWITGGFSYEMYLQWTIRPGIEKELGCKFGTPYVKINNAGEIEVTTFDEIEVPPV